jgi:hypothetical protein
MATTEDYQDDGRKYQVGETLQTDQGNMIVHGVSYQERVNDKQQVERVNFTYHLRHEEDMAAELEAQAAAAKAQAKGDKAAGEPA